ncbi:ATP-binding protein [Actinomadura sp. WAC 06369]|uniref:ATP-binding protein n=1 Tax=Actinomadura sp. WAC 06369 TaxID=2203193 RepID=UPI001315584C|nr:ATP-binding protein [Actinomadura sp. WAC 06369]
MSGDLGSRWPLRDETEFVCLPSAPRLARRDTAMLLAGWALDHLANTAQLLVSELTTNAYKAAGVDVEVYGYMAIVDVSPIHLRLATDLTRLLIEVWDGDPRPPVAKEAGPDAEGGRGLLLVSTLAERWNYYFPQSGGKVVWCETTGVASC